MRLTRFSILAAVLAAACSNAAEQSLAHTPTRVAFLTEPSSVAVDSAMSGTIDVGIVDNTGTVLVTAHQPVMLAIGNNPGGATLSGTTTASAVNGIATFSGLKLNKAGTGYTLVASSAGLTPDTSAAFNVTP